MSCKGVGTQIRAGVRSREAGGRKAMGVKSRPQRWEKKPPQKPLFRVPKKILQHKTPNELMARKGALLKKRDPSYPQTGIFGYSMSILRFFYKYLFHVLSVLF